MKNPPEDESAPNSWNILLEELELAKEEIARSSAENSRLNEIVQNLTKLLSEIGG